MVEVCSGCQVRVGYEQEIDCSAATLVSLISDAAVNNVFGESSPQPQSEAWQGSTWVSAVAGQRQANDNAACSPSVHLSQSRSRCSAK